MPELPEVETTRLSLMGHVVGARVVQVRMGKPLRWPLGVDPQGLQGLTVSALSRRGKYLWMALSDDTGTSRGGLLLHLGMSGSLAWLHVSANGAAGAAGAHDHFDMHTAEGVLRLTDPRRFGAVVWSPSLTQEPALTLLSRLGPEPFDEALTPLSFHASLQRHRVNVKAVLLSGTAIVGAGNIYACEALFAAGIDPRLSACRVSRPRAARLLAALRDILARAISAGGTTLRDFRNAYGDRGSFQNHAQIYGREGLPCVTCSTPVRRIVQGQRSTFLCATCQKR
jgi:formamidopyrimidine-DNA glycosylase